MLQFRDLKQNNTVHILDKRDVTLKVGKIVSTAFSRLETDTRTGKQQMMKPFSIECDGQTLSFTIPESSSVCNCYDIDLVIATDKSLLSKEVEIICNDAEEFLNTVDAQIERKRIEKERGSEILIELNPAYKEKQETEKRFSQIEGNMSEMKDMIKSQNEMIEGLVKALKG